jgi:hypothetical protein
VKPLALDLCSGLGGWAEGLLAAGWDVIGFDIEHRFIGRYPGQLVLQDIRTIDGTRMRGRVDLIVASPPCQEYSYRAMPWKRAKALPPPSSELFDACFRIAREAECPIVVENVKGAQPWVGRARWHYGSFYLWGDVPALMPTTLHRKVPGMNFHEHEKTGKPGRSFQSAAVDHTKNNGGSWFAVAHNTESGVGQNPVNGDGVKQHGSGPVWFDTGIAKHGSRSHARREASAQIAKIPFALAYHIGQCFLPAAVQP